MNRTQRIRERARNSEVKEWNYLGNASWRVETSPVLKPDRSLSHEKGRDCTIWKKRDAQCINDKTDIWLTGELIQKRTSNNCETKPNPFLGGGWKRYTYILACTNKKYFWKGTQKLLTAHVLGQWAYTFKSEGGLSYPPFYHFHLLCAYISFQK